MKRIGVLTSGGDAPGMNAAVRGVVRTALDLNIEVYGYIGGYQGLIDNNYSNLSSRDVSNILYSGGTVLKTSRCNDFKTKEGINKAVENLKKENVDGLVIIGGDGTHKGAMELEKLGIKVAFIPATIDNDMLYTHNCLGFDTACDTIMNVVNSLRDTSSALDRVFVVEVMGAFCGDLALYAGVSSGADIILVPEVKTNIEEVCAKLKEFENRGKKSSIIFVNEKVWSADALVNELKKHLSTDIRGTVLGHIQRGGNPTCLDRILGTKFGVLAVENLVKGKSVAVGNEGTIEFVVPLSKAQKPIREFDRKLLKSLEIMAK